MCSQKSCSGRIVGCTKKRKTRLYKFAAGFFFIQAPAVGGNRCMGKQFHRIWPSCQLNAARGLTPGGQKAAGLKKKTCGRGWGRQIIGQNELLPWNLEPGRLGCPPPKKTTHLQQIDQRAQPPRSESTTPLRIAAPTAAPGASWWQQPEGRQSLPALFGNNFVTFGVIVLKKCWVEISSHIILKPLQKTAEKSTQKFCLFSKNAQIAENSNSKTGLEPCVPLMRHAKMQMLYTENLIGGGAQ